MFLEAARQAEHPAADGLQIMKVERAFLSLAEFRQHDRMNRSAYDSRFDERARIQPDHRRAVVERLEVVLLRALVHRQGPVHRDVRQIGQVNLFPLLEASRMRSNEDPGRTQRRIMARPNLLDPATHELRL
jgi:hypothetical protein